MTPADEKAVPRSAGTSPLSGVKLAEMEVLRALAAQREIIVAHLGGGALKFLSRLRFVDPNGQHVVIEPSADAAANAALLALPRVLFVADLDEGRIEFAAAEPEQIVQGGKAAIQLRFPEVITSRRRRAFERGRVPPGTPVRCVASADGVEYFEASVLDISQGGIGVLQPGPNIPLEAGTMLRGCRIECLGRDPIVVTLEVRHAGPAALADGSPAQRAGCRFVNLPAVSAELIELVGQFLAKTS